MSIVSVGRFLLSERFTGGSLMVGIYLCFSTGGIFSFSFYSGYNFFLLSRLDLDTMDELVTEVVIMSIVSDIGGD